MATTFRNNVTKNIGTVPNSVYTAGNGIYTTVVGMVLANLTESVVYETHLVPKKLNIKRLSIETGAGKFFEPARKLFEKCDFKPCKPFAHYKEDINSIYLTRLINNE